MDSQQATTNVTKTTELTDLEDRSRFLKSLGFARDRMVQGNAVVQTIDSAVENNEAVDDGMVLSSNFNDDEELESSSSPVLMDSARGISEPFGLGEIDLGGDVQDEKVLEIETRFAEESSFNLAGIDDATWDAVSFRLRPEPANWKEAEAILEADLKKKTVPQAVTEPVTNSVSETSRSATPPPLPEDDDIQEILIDSPLDQEIKKAVGPPSNNNEPPRDESLTVNCPSCERGLTLQPEHLGIPGCCVWCETPIIAATSGVDHTVGVFELAILKPEQEEVNSVSPLKPKADAGVVGHSKLADLPTAETSAPQVETPAPEPVAEEKLEEPEVTLPPTDEKPSAARSQEQESEVEVQADTSPLAEEKGETPTDIETVEAIPRPKNNFPWNAPTAPKKEASASKLAPPPIEVESELLLDEITDPEPEERVDKAPAKEATPLVEVTSHPKEEEKPQESTKEPLPPIDSPLPELDTAALSSWTEPAASPFNPPVENKEEPKQENPATEPIQAASPFGSPAVSDQNEAEEKVSSPIKAVTPFDPIPNTTETRKTDAAPEEAKPTSFSAASPFGSPDKDSAMAEAVIPDSDEPQKPTPNPNPEESKPASFAAVSPFGSPVEDAAKAGGTESEAPIPAPEENKPTSFAAASPFGPPTDATEAPETADSAPLSAEAPAFDSVTPENESATPMPLPWDIPNDVVPDSDLFDAKPAPTDEDDPEGPPSDLPENEGPLLTPKDGPSAATVSTTIEKPVRRKKSRSSKSSRTAITIALLGLISGAGIASFFLPVGGYIENAKASWTEWFESKIGVENSWNQEGVPSATDEPVAIPAPDLPASTTAPETTPTPEVTPPASTSSEDEPDPFDSNKAPGS